MNVAIRRSQPYDIDACAPINYEAFKGISDRHQFPQTDFITVELAAQITRFWLESPSYFGVVAESEGAVVGCGFMDERNPIRGIGPVSVVGASRGVAIALFKAAARGGKS
ncbi:MULTISPECIES: hypothetical protein [unclassified Microcoleus]|uniref:hypothetical protein n=1 Tax=unclassified Microcoleus TaxID=2642155 RepID=UPI0025E35107|nr:MULTISPECIES: hypothetical protein [unclassified Microcoleus]